MEPANRNPVEIYNVINKDIENFPFVNSNYIEEKSIDSSHYKFSQSIGLGVLDILDYYPNLDD